MSFWRIMPGNRCLLRNNRKMATAGVLPIEYGGS